MPLYNENISEPPPDQKPPWIPFRVRQFVFILFMISLCCGLTAPIWINWF